MVCLSVPYDCVAPYFFWVLMYTDWASRHEIKNLLNVGLRLTLFFLPITVFSNSPNIMLQKFDLYNLPGISN